MMFFHLIIQILNIIVDHICPTEIKNATDAASYPS
jgi:hypothetical protein